MKPFGLVVDHVVIEYLLKQSRREQVALHRQILRLRDFPGNLSDYFEDDGTGRRYSVHVFGKHAVKYWIDDADRQVKIMEMRPSDHH